MDDLTLEEFDEAMRKILDSEAYDPPPAFNIYCTKCGIHADSLYGWRPLLGTSYIFCNTCGNELERLHKEAYDKVIKDYVGE